jgi:type I site-specific restriction-modification system R (restriction) subunit
MASRKEVRNLKKKIILPTILALSVLVVGILATSASAQDVSNYPPLVQKIADKFSLNVTDVQKVFDEERDARQANMYAQFAERLNDLVSEGKLTEAQEEAILVKHEEMQNKMGDLKGLSHEERHQKMQEFHEEFKTWAEELGINLPLIGPFGGEFRKGFKAGHMMGPNN